MNQHGFWVVNASTVLRGLIFKCVQYRECQRKAGAHKMADLSKERLCKNPPFTHCVVDIFGPFMVKVQKSDLKCHVVIFNCMASHTVQIQVTCPLDADSFIQALRHFIARCGNFQTLWSDNESNFIRAERKLWKTSLEKVQSKVKDFL